MNSDDRYAASLRSRLGDGYQDAITLMQQRLRPRFVMTPRTNREYIRTARWWDLEAQRGYIGVVDEHGMNSSERSHWYASNMRWAAERVDNRRMTWLEIVREAGINPGVRLAPRKQQKSGSRSG